MFDCGEGKKIRLSYEPNSRANIQFQMLVTGLDCWPSPRHIEAQNASL